MRQPVAPLPPPELSPPLRAPHLGLPPYRYVPGLGPHPLRHPQGHRWGHPVAPLALPWHLDPRWLHGLDLFDHRFYWEAHETWEQLWQGLDRSVPAAGMLQGLIQAAAAVLRAHAGDPASSTRLHGRARARLLRASRELGAVAFGVDLPATVQALDDFAGGGPWPLLGRPVPAER
ncbi:DUF309 domain-containing protein [Myxococcota bacterium]|nr:DUF309 domain-containing protein [Myxococcota bacterium]